METAASPSASAIAMAASAIWSRVSAGLGPRVGLDRSCQRNSAVILRSLRTVSTVHRNNCLRRTQFMDILISGASIAGPALAYWLGRYGFRPTIVEIAAEL